MNVVPGADPEPITGTLAFRFTWSRGGVKDQAPGQWRSEQRSPYRGAPWLKPDAPRFGTADVSDSSGGLVLQTAGGLTLLEGIGKTL